MTPEIEHDLKVETEDSVYFIRKHLGTPEFYIYDSDGESVTWGLKEDGFMSYLIGLGEVSVMPVPHDETPMGPK